jgi:hypothetical protein
MPSFVVLLEGCRAVCTRSQVTGLPWSCGVVNCQLSECGVQKYLIVGPFLALATVSRVPHETAHRDNPTQTLSLNNGGQPGIDGGQPGIDIIPATGGSMSQHNVFVTHT